MQNDINKNIFQIMRFFLFLFVILIANLSYIQIIESNSLVNNAYNTRLVLREGKVVRGSILSKNGTVLAYSKKNGTEIERIYPEGAIFAVPVGYVGKRIGNAGVEATENAYLCGVNMFFHQLGPLEQLLQPKTGDNVVLTLNSNLQKTAWRAMGARRGAVVVLNPQTGAVLAMVSKPSFNPNSINQNWQSLSKETNSPLINRAVQGLYPPGSTIKPLIADAALKEGIINQSDTIDCKGYYDLGNGQRINENDGEVHGIVNLKQALTVSCNVMFADLAVKLGANNLDAAFKRFAFNKKIDTDFYTPEPHLPHFSQLSKGEIAQIGIGQANLVVSPLRMAMLAASFTNGGKMMTPYLIEDVQTPNKIPVYKTIPKVFAEVTTPERAAIIENDMRNVVLHGTGTAANVRGVEVYGKTGTAQNSTGKDHAWFIGNATFPNGQKIAFAVILENSGFGGAEAAPVAQQIIETMLKEEQ